MLSSQELNNEHLSLWLEELIRFGSVANNVFEPAQINDNAFFLKGLLEQNGFSVQLWQTPSGKPYVFAELQTDAALPTLLIYSHYDGVPVNHEHWKSEPYIPTLLNEKGKQAAIMTALAQPETHRIYGRSVADSKNAIISILAALDRLRTKGQIPGVNIKLLLDGEEELESPYLKEVVRGHCKELNADLFLSASGETHQSGLPTIAFGVRGILMLDMTIYTAVSDMHSGHFGNFTPNAGLELAHLISQLKSKNGKVLIPGFYNGVKPLSAEEQNTIVRLPKIEQEVRLQFGIKQPEQSQSLQELINQPTFNIRGISAGYVGAMAGNIIPSQAQVSIDCRLVDGMDPDRIYNSAVRYLEKLGYHLCTEAPSLEELNQYGTMVMLERKGHFKAVKTDMNSGLPRRVLNIVQRSTDEPWVVEPTEGGSLNFEVFKQMGLPVITLPISNFDCNQHSHNENLRIDYFVRGISIFENLLAFKD